MKIGDKITASYNIVAGRTIEQEIEVFRPINENNNDSSNPWKHDIREVKVRFVVLKNSLGKATISTQDLKIIVSDANERLAQTGIRIKRTAATAEVIDPPTSPASNGIPAYSFTGTFSPSNFPIATNTLSSDEVVFAKLKDQDADSIDIFFVDSLSINARAVSYRTGINGTGNSIYNNWIVVDTTKLSGQEPGSFLPHTLPHEIMHILLNKGHRNNPATGVEDPDTALFYSPTSYSKEVSGTKRIGPYPDATDAHTGEADSTTMRANAEKLP